MAGVAADVVRVVVTLITVEAAEEECCTKAIQEEKAEEGAGIARRQ